MPDIRLKRIHDAPEPEDGLRILATRYWPRGVSRERADWYEPKAAPSRELLHAFKHEGLPWDTYVARYTREMQSEEGQTAIGLMVDAARSGTITVMCVCEDSEYCHRSLLKKLILEHIDV